MNMQLFTERLTKLVEECGGRLATTPVVSLRPEREETLIKPGGVIDPTYRRIVSPFVIEILIHAEVETVSDWQRIDCRRGGVV